MRTVVTSLVFVAACSARSGGPAPVPHPGSAVTPADAAPQVAAGPSERECDALFAHAIALKLAEQRARLPADQLPTAEEQAAVAAELRKAMLADCLAGTREGYDCALAATTLAAIAACQARPSSSTSNSSVAPGGITPAAPRSP